MNEKFDRFLQAAAVMIVEKQYANSTILQLKFRIGYNRAGRIIDQLEEVGVVSKTRYARPRDILIKDIPSLNAVLQRLELGEQTLSEPFWENKNINYHHENI